MHRHFHEWVRQRTEVRALDTYNFLDKASLSRHRRDLRVAVNAQVARQNRLIACLPQTEFERWIAVLEPLDLPLGTVLYEPGQSLDYIYFPTTAIVSLVHVMENGASAEVAVAGNEGLVGFALYMGGQSTLGRAVVQSGGHGLRLEGSFIKAAFFQAGAAHDIVLRYTQALMTQVAQTAVCNRHHSLDQQLCRWLLLCLDRLEGPDLMMTQELISNMLGVRREGVTEAAVKLQKAGLIRYSRGHITVCDRPALELRSCECYRVVKQEYDRLLPPISPPTQRP